MRRKSYNKLILSSLGITSLVLATILNYGIHPSSANTESNKTLKIKGLLEGNNIAVKAAKVGNPWVNFADGKELIQQQIEINGVAKEIPSQMTPLSLAAGDFDQDGIEDLLSGYSADGKGYIILNKGNIDSRYPYGAEALAHKAKGEYSEVPFLASEETIQIPSSPDFLIAGDFDGDTKQDIVVATRGNNVMRLYSGNGQGSLTFTKEIKVDGQITALNVGDVNVLDGVKDVVVGLKQSIGSEVLVYECPTGALKGNIEPEVFQVSAVPTSFAMSDLNEDGFMDLAIATGSEIMIIQGRNRNLSSASPSLGRAKISKHSLSSAAKSIVIGDFTGDNKNDLAVLLENGQIELFSKNASIKKLDINSWKNSTVDSINGATELIASKVSALQPTDLIAIGTDGLHILSTSNQIEKNKIAVLETAKKAVCVMSMRLNNDGLEDLVVLSEGQNSLSSIVTKPLATFTVTNTNDAGAGSLRTAIALANISLGLDNIEFNIPIPGAKTINLLTPLPPITSPVNINGLTQPGGFGATPMIQLNGTGIPAPMPPATANGLIVVANGSTISGLAVFGFPSGVGIAIAANGCTVHVCYLGTNLFGEDRGNRIGISLLEGASNNTIGLATTATQSNTICNNDTGIDINNATFNKIQNNSIGIQTTFSGVGGGNDFNGIDISNGSRNNTIGGTAGLRNVIAGNGQHGILVRDGATSSNLITGNKIGMNDVPFGVANGGDGIRIENGSFSNAIGNSTGGGNAIGGNGQFGIELVTAGIGNFITGNTIGATFGLSSVPNGTGGIRLEATTATLIGGTLSGQRNIITKNNGAGVSIIEGPVAIPNIQNEITRNSIFENTELGIDLGNKGVNANDTGDSDTGANNLQNFPVFTQLFAPGNFVRIIGSLNTTPNTTCRIEFFRNVECDPSEFGEGQDLIGSTVLTTNGIGNIPIDITFTPSVRLGATEGITATTTVTHINATAVTPFTSEFSNCLRQDTGLSSLFVSDTNNNRIQQYNGVSWSVLGSDKGGSNPGEFNTPEAVTANFDLSRIYVADTGNNRIQRLDVSTNTWTVIAEGGSTIDRVSKPQGIVVDRDGNLYIADTGNDRVLRYTFDGIGNVATRTIISDSGSGAGQVTSPRGLAISLDFVLYIAATGNNNVLRITNANTVGGPGSGTIVAQAGSTLTPGCVFAPEGVIVDRDGNLFVADTKNDRVIRFIGGNPGTAQEICSSGSSLETVIKPEGITISRFLQGPLALRSTLVVSDTGNHEIQAVPFPFTLPIPAASWQKLDLSVGGGSAIGQFNSPSKIR